MPTIHNDIIINAPMKRIWEALTIVDLLETYDPTVKKSTAISNIKSGIGAKRKVDMIDDKNWFEEECTISKTNESLTFELTACSFPVHSLKHDYSFEKAEDKTRVKQVMNYKMKFGLLGQFMGIMLKPKWNKGINEFLGGLKRYSESNG